MVCLLINIKYKLSDKVNWKDNKHDGKFLKKKRKNAHIFFWKRKSIDPKRYIEPENQRSGRRSENQDIF